MLAARCIPAVYAATAASNSRSSPADPAAACRLRPARHPVGGTWGSRSLASYPLAALQRPALSQAAAHELPGSQVAEAGELPLWRLLRQQGFSAGSIGRMQAAVSSGKARCSIRSGERLTEKKLQRDLAPNIAALRAEGLDTASIERLFEQLPSLLTATQETFASSLAALQRLAALLPDDPRAVQAPPGATQLGVALWLYPDAAARLLQRANLDSLIDGNLQLRRQLGISDAEGAKALFENLALVADFERAEAMVAHLQRLHASGALSSEHVAGLAQTAALSLTPAEFDRRWREGGLSQASVGAMKMIGMKDPAGRQRAAAEALGELLQAADGMPGPLQQQYRQQGDLLVARNRQLWTTGAPALRAAWASLQHLGLSSSQVVALVQKQPAVLTYNWDGEAKRLLLAWVQQELGLSPQDFLASHAVYATYSVATLAIRADFLRQHRHALWAEVHSRGIGPLLSLLTAH